MVAGATSPVGSGINHNGVDVIVDRDLAKNPVGEEAKVEVQNPVLVRARNGVGFLKDHDELRLPAILAPVAYHQSPLLTRPNPGPNLEQATRATLFADPRNARVSADVGRAGRGLERFLTAGEVPSRSTVAAVAKAEIDQLARAIERYYAQRGLSVPGNFRSLLKDVLAAVTSRLIDWNRNFLSPERRKGAEQLVRIIFVNTLEVLESSGLRSCASVWQDPSFEARFYDRVLDAIEQGEKAESPLPSMKKALQRVEAEYQRLSQAIEKADSAASRASLTELQLQVARERRALGSMNLFLTQVGSRLDSDARVSYLEWRNRTLAESREKIVRYLGDAERELKNPGIDRKFTQQKIGMYKEILKQIDWEVGINRELLLRPNQIARGPLGGLTSEPEINLQRSRYSAASWARLAREVPAVTFLIAIPFLAASATTAEAKDTWRNPHATAHEKGAAIVEAGAATGLAASSTVLYLAPEGTTLARAASRTILPAAIVMEGADIYGNVARDLNTPDYGPTSTRLFLNGAKGGSAGCMIAAPYLASNPWTLGGMLLTCGGLYFVSDHEHDAIAAQGAETTILQKIGNARAQARTPGGNFEEANAKTSQELSKALSYGEFDTSAALGILKTHGGFKYGAAVQDWRNDPALKGFIESSYEAFRRKAVSVVLESSFTEFDAAALLFFGLSCTPAKYFAVKKFLQRVEEENRQKVWQAFVDEVKLDKAKYGDLDQLYQESVDYRLDQELRHEGWNLGRPIPAPERVSWQDPGSS